jgi:citronellol/citronellal dehydrogenase
MARRFARDGANVTICAKTVESHPTLPGTIYTAAKEVEALGGRALACVVDVRDEASIKAAVAKTVEAFGGIDILVNCASAIFPSRTEEIDLKRLNLMWEVTTRAPLLMAKHCVPHLKASAKAGRNPHILTCSPPTDYQNWPEPSEPNYMVCKMGMTVGTLALANELKGHGVAANTLWPATPIATSAVNHMAKNDREAIDRMFLGAGRVPEIQADAAYAIFSSDSLAFTGNMTIDEDVVVRAGCKDLSVYDYETLGTTMEERVRRILN